jgi:predicted component of type VI protein secretion system
VRAAAASALFLPPRGEPSGEVLQLHADLACARRDFERAAAAEALPATLAMHALGAAAAALRGAGARCDVSGGDDAAAHGGAAAAAQRRADGLEALLRRVARHGADAPAALAAEALAGREG